jgi:hypothetical protein
VIFELYSLAHVPLPLLMSNFDFFLRCVDTDAVENGDEFELPFSWEAPYLYAKGFVCNLFVPEATEIAQIF